MTIIEGSLIDEGSNSANKPDGGESFDSGSMWSLFYHTFIENKFAIAGLVIVILLVLFSFIGPIFYHTNQVLTTYNITLPPGKGHPLGTDESGRDVLGRLMVAGQSSIEIGLIVALIATTIGVLWGAIAGYFGKWTSTIMMRVVDVFLAIPSIYLLLFLTATAKSISFGLLVGVLSLISWLVPSRLVYGETLSIKTREYVKAVKVMGGGPSRIIIRHVVPNVVGTMVVNATFQIADAIAGLATLSFLGFGLAPPAANWGEMLSNGINYISDGYWWLFVPVGLILVITIIAFNLIGDALRDALEVRLQRR